MNTLLFNTLVLCFSIVVAGCSIDPIISPMRTVLEYNLPTSGILAEKLVEHSIPTASGSSIIGYDIRQPDSSRIQPHYVVIIHHGSEGTIQDYWETMESLYTSGYDVFIYDYQGYGRSTGHTTIGNMIADARVVTDYVRLLDTSRVRVVHYGVELGSVPAIAQSIGDSTVKGLILESGVATSDAYVQSMIGFDVRSTSVMSETFNNVDAISEVNVPVMFFHGDKDVRISPNNTRVLYNATTSPKLLHIVNGAGYGSIRSTLTPEYYRTLIKAFLETN